MWLHSNAMPATQGTRRSSQGFAAAAMCNYMCSIERKGDRAVCKGYELRKYSHFGGGWLHASSRLVRLHTCNH